MGKGTFTVALEDVRLYAYHGVFDHERREGNEFRYDLKVTYGSANNGREIEDDLSLTVSYAELYEIVKEVSSRPHKLLETVVSEIVNIIRERYPFIMSAECRLTKLQPPIPAFQGSAFVEYSWNDKK